jgi:hypothetical protein
MILQDGKDQLAIGKVSAKIGKAMQLVFGADDLRTSPERVSMTLKALGS